MALIAAAHIGQRDFIQALGGDNRLMTFRAEVIGRPGLPQLGLSFRSSIEFVIRVSKLLHNIEQMRRSWAVNLVALHAIPHAGHCRLDFRVFAVAFETDGVPRLNRHLGRAVTGGRRSRVAVRALWLAPCRRPAVRLGAFDVN